MLRIQAVNLAEETKQKVKSIVNIAWKCILQKLSRTLGVQSYMSTYIVYESNFLIGVICLLAKFHYAKVGTQDMLILIF